MKLNFKIEAERTKGFVYLKKLLDEQAMAEIRKIPSKRTLNQNSYVHKLFQLWGMEFGYTTEEAKTVVKRELGYVYTRNGEKFLKRTSKMDTKELTEFIDKFRNWSAANGYYLPSADQMSKNNAYFEQELERAAIMERRYGY